MGTEKPSTGRTKSARHLNLSEWSFGGADAATSGGQGAKGAGEPRLLDGYPGRGQSVAALREIAREIVACDLCPRLRDHCREVAATRRAAYRLETYWGLPVPGFGDPDAWLLLVGLAPGAHGSNRTGRMFTGDRSGEWLYGELHRQGFADRATSERAGDGLALRGVYIAAAGRCAPPGNKPTPEELRRCRPFLVREIAALRSLRVRLALGKIGFDALLAARRDAGLRDLKPRPVFGHGASVALPEGGWLLATYHPSQQNTSTRLLTPAMWRDVFVKAKALRDRV
jgi:uracil-DNA glycosylase family 4